MLTRAAITIRRAGYDVGVARLRFSLTLVSLACCILLLGFWGWSYRRAYATGYATPGPAGSRGVSGWVVCGKIVVTWGESNGVPEPSPLSVDAYPRPDGYDLVGAAPMEDLWGYERSTFVNGTSATLWFPIWLPAGVAAIPPAAWAWRRRRRGGRGFPVAAEPEPVAGEVGR